MPPVTQFRWTRSQAESLIGLVFQKTILWDKTELHKNPHEQGEAWTSIANQLGIAREKVKNKWRSLVTLYEKHKNVPKPKSGSGAKKQKGKWYVEAMSFMKGKSNASTTGNFDFLDDDSDEDDDDEDDDDEEAMETSPITKPLPQSAQHSPVPTKKEQNAMHNPISEIIPSLKPENPTNEAAWNLLLSILPYLSRVQGAANKMQLRVEIYCLLLNFLTDNSAIAESANKEVNKEAMESNNQTRNHDEHRPSTSSGIIHVNHDERRPCTSTGIMHVMNEHRNGPSILRSCNENSENDDVYIVSCASSQKAYVKQENQELPKHNVDIKPSAQLQNLLKNPFLIKKEK